MIGVSIRPLAFSAFLLVSAGCAPTPGIPASPARPDTLPDPVPAGSATYPSVSALFSERPTDFLAAAAAACNAPGQSVVRPAANVLRCESLPEPDAAASLVLAYDGDLTDLPRFVIQFIGTSLDAGYRIRVESFIDIPQRDGRRIEIRPDDSQVMASFAALLTRAGGVVQP